MNNEVIINSNFAEDICCEWVEIGISYTADVKKAKALMKEEVTSHPLFIDHRSKKEKETGEDIAPVRVVSVGDVAITLRAWTWAANPGETFILGCDLNENIKERFDREGIEIPYPYSNVILRNNQETKEDQQRTSWVINLYKPSIGQWWKESNETRPLK